MDRLFLSIQNNCHKTIVFQANVNNFLPNNLLLSCEKNDKLLFFQVEQSIRFHN